MAVTADIQSATITLPPKSLTDAWWSATSGDELVIAKQRHRKGVPLFLTDGTDVTALSQVVHIADGKGLVTGVEVTPGETAPNGGDKIFTVDVLKSTGGGAFASILLTTKAINTSSTALTPETATVQTTAYGKGDAFQIAVTVSGSSGNQGQGGCVVLWLDEEPS